MDKVVCFSGNASESPGHVAGQGLNPGIVELTGDSVARDRLGLVHRHVAEPDHGPTDVDVGVFVQSIGGACGDPWTFYRSAPITMPDLLSGKYAVVVRTSPEDGSADIFCGDVAHATR